MGGEVGSGAFRKLDGVGSGWVPGGFRVGSVLLLE